MIIIIDSNATRARAIMEKYAACYSCAVVESPEQMMELALSENPVAVIADTETLDGMKNGWANLFLLNRAETRIVLLAKGYSRQRIDALNAQSIWVLDADADIEELEYILSSEEKTSRQGLQDQPKNISRLRDHIFSNLLDGNNVPDDEEAVMNLLGLTSELDRYYLAFVISFSSGTKEWLMENVWETALRIQEITREEISKIAVNRSCIRSSARIAFLIRMRQPGEEFRYVLEMALEGIQKRIAKECGKKIAVGVGLAELTINSIADSYRQACDALSQGKFYGSNFVCFHCDLFDYNTQRFSLQRDFKERLMQHLYRDELEQIDDLLESQFEQFYDLGLATKESTMALKLDLAVFFMDIADKLGVSAKIPQFYSRVTGDFLAADSLSSLEFVIKKHLREIAYTAQNEYDKRTGQIVRNAQMLIAEHIEEPINVQLLAQWMRISPNYLSAVFKSETGVRLSEYITNVKMQEAARRIRESQKSIAEISADLGYDSASYFSKLFKKQYGVTPSDYRISNGPNA